MAFSIFFSASVILLITFLVMKKNLHLFELIFIWMVVLIIDHMVLTILAINLELFDFGLHPANYWILVLLRVFLYPLLFVLFFDLTSRQKPYTMWLCLPLLIAILTGMEYLADVLHVYKHIRWKLWWSLIEWFGTFGTVYLTWIWYRNQLRKELRS